MNSKQLERLNNVNNIIELIATTDHKMLGHEDRVGKFVPLKTTVKYLDAYTQKLVTVNDNNNNYHFSNGGTMWALIKDFKEYIITGKYTNGENGYGGLYCSHWAYTEEGQQKIIDYAKQVGYLK